MYTSQFHASQMESGSSSPSPLLGHPGNQPGKPTRRRAPKACGECRRLKLKCDRVFPCQSCVKRGCEGICPEGSLVSGRGSRYILANTEQLHEKIIQLTDRIRELEDALRAKCEEHARCLNPKLPPIDPPHPLLREDLLLIKNQLELYGLDRSQLGSRSSDSQYLSDGSDLDPRLGGDQHQPYSPLEMLYPNSAQQLMEPAHARHVRGHNFSTVAQTSSDGPFVSSQWLTNSQASTPYGSEMDMAHNNSVTQAPYSYTGSYMPGVEGQLQGYHGRSSQHLSQGVMSTSTSQYTNDPHHHASTSYSHNQSMYYHPPT